MPRAARARGRRARSASEMVCGARRSALPAGGILGTVRREGGNGVLPGRVRLKVVVSIRHRRPATRRLDPERRDRHSPTHVRPRVSSTRARDKAEREGQYTPAGRSGHIFAAECVKTVAREEVRASSRVPF